MYSIESGTTCCVKSPLKSQNVSSADKREIMHFLRGKPSTKPIGNYFLVIGVSPLQKLDVKIRSDEASALATLALYELLETPWPVRAELATLRPAVLLRFMATLLRLERISS